MIVTRRQEVFEAISRERDHQDDKWGVEQPQSFMGLVAVMRAELAEVEAGWLKNLPGKSAPLNELVQVAATAVAALEKYGLEGCPGSTDDVPPAIAKYAPEATHQFTSYLEYLWKEIATAISVGEEPSLPEDDYVQVSHWGLHPGDNYNSYGDHDIDDRYGV